MSGKTCVFGGVATLTVVAAFAGPVVAQQSQIDNLCYAKEADGVPQISACTIVILSGRESKKNLAHAYYNRGNGYRGERDYDRAIADYTEAIRLHPKYVAAYSNCGQLNLYVGALPRALTDFNQATTLDPKSARAALWLDIVAQRNNVPSRLSQAISNIDMTAWPAPVIRMFLGQVTAAAVLAAADNPDARKKKDQVCEANFYSGEWALRQGTKDEALRLFQLAAADCPRISIGWFAANAELKALGAAR